MISKEFKQEVEEFIAQEDTIGVCHTGNGSAPDVMVFYKYGVEESKRDVVVMQALGVSYQILDYIKDLSKEELLHIEKLAKLHKMKRDIINLENEIVS